MHSEFEQDAVGSQPADKAKLSAVYNIAHRQMQEEDLVAKLERELADAKAKLYKTQTVDLPQAMSELGLRAGVTLTDGSVIKVQPFFEASIPSQTAIDKAKGEDKSKLINRMQACFSWLRENGYGGIIKRDVIASFGRGEDAKAEVVYNELVAKGMSVSDKSSVHPSTLKSFVKERVESGDSTFPMDTFAVTIGNISKIERA